MASAAIDGDGVSTGKLFKEIFGIDVLGAELPEIVFGNSDNRSAAEVFKTLGISKGEILRLQRLGNIPESIRNAWIRRRVDQGLTAREQDIDYDELEAVRELSDQGESQRAIAQIVGANRETVGEDLRVGNPTVLSEKSAETVGNPTVTSSESPPSAKDAATEKRAAKEAEREARREKNAELVAATPDPLMSGARFATIMLDPPWDWGDEGDQDQMGRAKPTYATMPFEQILQLPIPILSDKDCHLYLWITNRSLPKGFTLIERWGFRYITCVTWAKPHFGMGNYFRGQTEHVLFGVKGSQPLKRADVGTLFPAPRGPLGHSSKPPEFYGLVESCSPGPYLEMFARQSAVSA